MTSSEAPSPRYRLKFLPDALDEWNALDGSVKEVLKKLLKKRLEQPRVPGAELHGDLRDCYKIKLRKRAILRIPCGQRLRAELLDQLVHALSAAARQIL